MTDAAAGARRELEQSLARLDRRGFLRLAGGVAAAGAGTG